MIEPEPGLQKLHQLYGYFEVLGKEEGPEPLLRYMVFVEEYRSGSCDQLKETMTAFNERHSKVANYIRIGSNILQLCTAISSVSLFGVLFFFAVEVTANKIGEMKEDYRVIFMAIVTPSAGKGSINRLVRNAMQMSLMSL